MTGESRIRSWLREWMLAIAISAGVGICLFYYAVPALHVAGPVLRVAARWLQPMLLFVMLFLSLCRVSPKEIRPHRWQIAPLLLQCSVFVALCLLLIAARNWEGSFFRWIGRHEILLQALLLCFITPTANSSVVVTGRLGGNVSECITYIILVNLITSVMIPFFLPMAYPVEGLSFGTSVLTILGKVFPLLIAPMLLAMAVRAWMPRTLAWVLRHPDLPFYLWSVLLVISIGLATRVAVLFEGSKLILLELAFAALAACFIQFALGHRFGRRYNRRVTAGQSLGQKNTSFTMWLGLTFLNPVVSVVGGFYSIWHNLYNTLQLQRHARHEKSAVDEH